MPTTIDHAELQARLDEFLARASSGERILVRDAAVTTAHGLVHLKTHGPARRAAWRGVAVKGPR